jgi:hypothetical protein
MFLNDEGSWPREVVRFLQEKEALFDDWYGPTNEYRTANCDRYSASGRNRFSASDHDQTLGAFDAMLRRHTLEGGHHCTRLTEGEFATILRDGMSLQNGRSLATRIQQLREARVVDEVTARTLTNNNWADQSNRAGLLWFCFYPPKLAGESGIEIFLRNWGGEGLSRPHIADPVLGRLLSTIGTPCVVIADVPITLLHSTYSLAVRLARQYFVNRGHELSEELILEAYTKRSLPPAAIRQILRYPDSAFVAVTGCDQWCSPLSMPANEAS